MNMKEKAVISGIILGKEPSSWAGIYKPRSMQNARSGQTKKVDEITNTEIQSIKHKQNNKR